MPVENIVWAHQQEYYAAIRKSGGEAGCGPFIDFMLDKILRALKAKGEAYEPMRKSKPQTTKKTTKKIMDIMKGLGVRDGRHSSEGLQICMVHGKISPLSKKRKKKSFESP